MLLGMEKGDAEADSEHLARKVVELRLFPDDRNRMNRSLEETAGEMLVVSQFTLAGDCRRGRRPSFDSAAPPALAEPLYEAFVAAVSARGIRTATGQFGAVMDVSLVNTGPVTLIVRSRAGAASDAASGE